MSVLGVVGGFSDYSFRPNAPVTRAQVASMLVRLHTEVFEGTFPVADATFGDIAGNPHREAIVRLVGGGITQGLTATTFGPGHGVTRGQMATFLMRYADVLVGDGHLALPEHVDVPEVDLCRDVPFDIVAHYLPGEPLEGYLSAGAKMSIDGCAWDRPEGDPAWVEVLLSYRTLNDLRLDEHNATREDLPWWITEVVIDDGVSVFLFDDVPTDDPAAYPTQEALILYEKRDLGIRVVGAFGPGGLEGLHKLAVELARLVPQWGLKSAP